MDQDLLGLIRGASAIVQLVMASLAIGSVASWAIIFFKMRELRAAELDTEEFVQAYHERPVDAVYDVARENDSSPLAALFITGYRELSQYRKVAGSRAVPPEQIESLVRRLEWVQLLQMQRSERGLSFLATTGSTAPFVGLLGTVIGIMNAFNQIGAQGQASLVTVGPAIAEALLATAIGLFAAIPAVVAFNYLAARTTRLTERLDAFRSDFTQYLRGAMTSSSAA
jgi:biopolymer transport protein TolQ